MNILTHVGLDCIYILDMKKVTTKIFGSTGTGPGMFKDPAGITSDSQGTMIVADSRNHRLQIFDKKRKFLGLAKGSPPLNRPSGMYLDSLNESGPLLYVLNLWGDSMVRYAVE